VVASRAGAVPEVVGDAAVLVDPLDDRAWAAAIRRVVDDDAQCDALRAAGNEHAARFRWDRTARETVAVHEECATDGR
jgi:glycosyltransferase involved in cell wall biosynthesis